MTSPRSKRLPPISITIGAGLLTTLFAGNGLWMISAPERWYWRVPGVAETGPFNQHFIRDIGFIYVATSVAVAAGVLSRSGRPALWTTAAAWHACHSLFHVWEVATGICAPAALLRDFLGVTAPSVLAVALATWACRTTRQDG